MEVKHNVGRDKAIEKIDKFLDDLSRKEVPGGVQVINPSKKWNDNVMTLSFKAKKGFIGVDVRGQATVNEDNVIIEIELPAILATFVKEDQIREVVSSQTTSLLSSGSTESD